jgi:hypothetical protein
MSTNRKGGARDHLAAQADYSRIRSDLRAVLLAARNPDGGWGYAMGRRSRIEPTCWAALALGHSEGRGPDCESLRVWTRQNDWLVDVAGAPPNNAFNALAALTFLQDASTAALAQPIVARLLQAKGRQFPQDDALRQDNSIEAWPWTEGTASWVEPTAWCLLLLKKVRPQSTGREIAARIRDGERLLFDRVCRDGGWNYGNSQVYGQELWPYVPTTAVALLAMRDHRHESVVTRSLDQLQKDVANERSIVAVTITIICLRSYEIATDVLERTAIALWEHADLDGSENLLGTAMMLYALTEASRQLAFKV